MNLLLDAPAQPAEPLPTTVSSPKLDLIQLTWNHIAERYLRRIESNRIYTGRVRAIRLLAVHDAIHSIIDPGNGHIYRDASKGTTIEAAFIAVAKSSHDVLATVFTSGQDREDLADLLEESLSLIGPGYEQSAGFLSGAESARAYLRNFAPLLLFTPRTVERPVAVVVNQTYHAVDAAAP